MVRALKNKRAMRGNCKKEDKLVDVRILGHVDQRAEREVRFEVRKSERVLLRGGRVFIPEELDIELAGVVVVAGLLVGVVEGSNLDEILALSDVILAKRYVPRSRQGRGTPRQRDPWRCARRIRSCLQSRWTSRAGHGTRRDSCPYRLGGTRQTGCRQA